MLVNHPVYTLDNLPLVAAGTVLSAGVLRGLVSSNAMTYQTCPLLEYGTVRRDLLRQMTRPPYDLIFSSREKTNWVAAAMEKIHCIAPVLQSLDYFKKDDYHTYCHVLMVSALSTLLARDLLPGMGWMGPVLSGPTHDIGKTCVPLNILKKDTPLTRSEKKIIDHHTIAGYVLLSYFHKEPRNFASIVARDHHERKDGSGSPRGIRLRDRMVEITVICDVYDALISPRPYRSASYDNRTALEEITRMAEMKKIRWEPVKCLVAHNRMGKPGYTEVKVSEVKRGTPPADNCYGVIKENDDGS